MNIPTYLQDPTTVAEHAIDEAVTIACIAVADQTRSLGLQAVHALLVLAIDYAWAPNRRATYGEEGKVKLCQHMKKKWYEVCGVRFYAQRPHVEKQSNKPKLQSRFPSEPTSQFLAFLLPPACIGAVPCKKNAN